MQINKLFSAYFISLSVIMILIIGSYVFYQKKLFEESFYDDLVSKSFQINYDTSHALSSDEFIKLKSKFQTLVNTSHKISNLYITDENCEILYTSATKVPESFSCNVEKISSVSPQKSLQSDYLRTLFYDSLKKQKINIVFELDREYVQQYIFKIVQLPMMIFSAVLVLFFVLSYIFMKRYFSNPIEVSDKKLRETIKSLDEEKQKTDELNEHLTKVLKQFSENVIASTSDIDGKILYVTKKLCEISGFSKEELLGENHNILRHPDMPSHVFENLWKTIKNGQAWEGKVKNRKKDGGYYWVHAIVEPLKGEDGAVIGFQSIRHDITHQKAKEQFMANVNHELRTPLNAIIGFNQIIYKNLKKKSLNKLMDFSSRIDSGAKSMLQLINDILDMSKIEGDQFSVTPYEFNGYKEIYNHSQHFQGLISDKKISLKTKVDKTLEGVFFGDWQRISQIVLNLISNALKFTPEGGEVRYHVKYSGNNLIITIKDNGIGMSKEAQDKIFKPFVQADGSTARKYGGTGLGLSITQKLVEMMEGRIQLESQEGEGTTFIVTLPLNKVDSNILSDTLDANVSLDEKEMLHGHILLVEDNKTNQLLMSSLLDDFGLSYDIVNDGLEAVAIYDPHKHQLVLMDENMPNMNGIEAMNELRKKHTKCTPIIALTASTMDNARERFLEMGMDDYLAKPIDDTLLYKFMKKYLSQNI